VRKHWIAIGFWMLVSIGLLVACAQQATTAAPVPPHGDAHSTDDFSRGARVRLSDPAWTLWATGR
jgi:hypothetical protein